MDISKYSDAALYGIVQGGNQNHNVVGEILAEIERRRDIRESARTDQQLAALELTARATKWAAVTATIAALGTLAQIFIVLTK
jgi:hypothetical protein